MRGRYLLPIAAAMAAVLGPAYARASDAALLRYGFVPGTNYAVTEKSHDVGKSVTEMDMMGQRQVIESPLDMVSQGSWTLAAAGKEGGGRVRASMDFGSHKGGFRGEAMSGGAEQVLGKSRASLVLDPRKGAVEVTVTPADPLAEMIMKNRLLWLPVLPEKSVRAGDVFDHSYVIQTQMMSVKVEDEYTVDKIKGGTVLLSVESRQVMVMKMQSPAPPPGMPAGIPGMSPMGDMNVVYKGKGSAVFDLAEGIFTEVESTLQYVTPKPSGGAFSTRMQGALKTRWEMERR